MASLHCVACLADKYNFANALTPISRAWLKRFTRAEGLASISDNHFQLTKAVAPNDNNTTTLQGYERLLLVSYAFKNADAFKTVSLQILLNWKDDFVVLRDIIDPPHRLPMRLFGKFSLWQSRQILTFYSEMLETRRTLVLDKVTFEVKTLLDSLSSKKVGPLNTPPHGNVAAEMTQHDAIRLSEYMVQIREKKLWPASLVNRTGDSPTSITAVYCIEEALSTLSTIRDFSSFPAGREYGNAYSLAPQCCRITLTSLLKQIADTIRDFANDQGVCIVCCGSDVDGARCMH